MCDYKSEINGVVCYKDTKGAWVPEGNIRAVDLLRDDVVRDVIKIVKNLSKNIAEHKEQIESEIADFIELSASQYGVTTSTVKGTTSYKTLDGRYEIMIAMSDYMEFNEEISSAKELVDKCLKKWTVGANKNLVAIVNDAFKVDKKGMLDTRRILSLRTYDIDDPDWKLAMEAISNSLTVGRTKKYIRFYETLENGAKKQIPLDWSNI